MKALWAHILWLHAAAWLPLQVLHSLAPHQQLTPNSLSLSHSTPLPRTTPRRFKLPIVVIVMNNGGIYGGDRRESALARAADAGAAAGGFGSDLPPTAFVKTRCVQLLRFRIA